MPGVRRGGTGLGLPYARRLAGLLGGELDADQRAGPRDHGRAPPAARPGRWARSSSRTTTPAFRQVLRGLLAGMAGQVIEAADGEQALAALAGAGGPGPGRPADARPGRLRSAGAAARRRSRRSSSPAPTREPPPRAAALLRKDELTRDRLAFTIRGSPGRAMMRAPGRDCSWSTTTRPSATCMATWLRRAGHTVTEAATGREALARLRRPNWSCSTSPARHERLRGLPADQGRPGHRGDPGHPGVGHRGRPWPTGRWA